MVCEGLCFVVVSGQLPKVAVDVVGITALGFQLNGHVSDAEIRRDPVLDQLQQLQPYVGVLRRQVFNACSSGRCVGSRRYTSLASVSS